MYKNILDPNDVDQLSSTDKATYTSIRALRKSYKESKEQLEKNYREQRVKLQTECSHSETSYNPDPSGNNGSWTECLICESELVRGVWTPIRREYN